MVNADEQGVAALPLSNPAAGPLPRWLAFIPVLLVLVGVIAWAGGLQAGFVFDDHPHIINNPAIHDVGQNLGQALRPRGLVWVTLSLNYAVGQRDPAGYHLVNVALHLLAGLALYGLAWRTLGQRLLADAPVRARIVAAVIALGWVVHPLQSQAVTYVIQRAEVMAGLFFLVGLYGLVRHHEATARGPRAGWMAAIWLSIVAAVLSKESGAVLPLVMVLYDRGLLAGTFREAWSKRRWLYGPCVVFVIAASAWAIRQAAGDRSVGYDVGGLTPQAYLFTQPAVITHYLRQVLWPHPLIFDYAWSPARHAGEQVPPFALIVTLGVLTLWALVRHWPIGVLGAWFFITLAPTSSFMPIADLAVEHRMYLPLAAVWAAMVLTVDAALRRLGPARMQAIVGGSLAVALLGVYIALTLQRTEVYRDDLTLWRSVVEQRPGNARAHMNYASALFSIGRDPQAAIEHYRQAIRLRPRYADAYSNLAGVYMNLGELDRADEALRTAATLHPGSVWVSRNQGKLAMRRKAYGEAEEHYRRAVEGNPTFGPGYADLGELFLAQNRIDDAEKVLDEAMRRAPQDPLVLSQMADLRMRQNRRDEAADYARRALALPNLNAKMLSDMGTILAGAGAIDEAMRSFQAAIEVDPTLSTAHSNLAGALLLKGRTQEALAAYDRALALSPRDVALVRRVAWLLATLPDERLRNAEQALRMATWANEQTQGKVPLYLQTLAAAQANAGQFEQAAATQEAAIAALPADAQRAVRESYAQALAGYRAGRAYQVSPTGR